MHKYLLHPTVYLICRNKMLKCYLHILNTYKKDLALNNQQELISHKSQPTKHLQIIYVKPFNYVQTNDWCKIVRIIY